MEEAIITRPEQRTVDAATSETIGRIADALSKAQGEVETAKRTSRNPFLKSMYADLESVWNACREPLAKNGLAVIQTLDGTPENLSVITTLAHSSGEWIRSRLTLKPMKTDPQAVGSAITYGRRYSLAAIVGVAPQDEDDDGNAASRDKDQGVNMPGRKSDKRKADPDEAPFA